MFQVHNLQVQVQVWYEDAAVKCEYVYKYQQFGLLAYNYEYLVLQLWNQLIKDRIWIHNTSTEPYRM